MKDKMIAAQFEILNSELSQKAFAALRDTLKREYLNGGPYMSAWIDMLDGIQCENGDMSLCLTFQMIGVQLHPSYVGGIDGIDVVQSGNIKNPFALENMLKAIAPFVLARSSIVFLNTESATVWRFFFDGDHLHREYAKIEWPEHAGDSMR